MNESEHAGRLQGCAPTNILELLKSSNKIALIQGKKRISYEALLDRGVRFGGRLRREGIGAGQYVLVFVPLSIELYTAMIGAWSIGAVPIFIDFSRGAKFVNDSIRRLRPDMIICDPITGFVRNIYAQMRRIKMLKINQSDQPVDIVKLKAGHPAILTFTSGSTGIPKVAVRTHEFLVNQYNALTAYLDFDENHVDLGTLPVFTLANLASNMTTLLPDKNYLSKINARRLSAKMDSERVTRAICSPALMERLLAYSSLPSLKCAYLGGGPVYPRLLEKIRKSVDIRIVYGSTEAEPIASVRWIDVSPEDRQKIAAGAGLLVGDVVPEVACRISAEKEILVSGRTVLQGYLDGIGDKENKIRDGAVVWHRTGDAGYIDEQGRLWLLGRVSQAIHDGKGTLYPFCIECVLDAHFGIRGAILSHKGERIVVIEEGITNPDDVLNRLKPFHIMSVIAIKKIPMDKRHGAKIDYRRLLETLESKLYGKPHVMQSRILHSKLSICQPNNYNYCLT
ncbi:MAG: AMP-binding protein [Tannerella sp.]|jgi:acyl-coenzyme A synthetase/AMP-(fatty) acid ligase|nr:AMP-binding protein [Tannerella sp.]